MIPPVLVRPGAFFTFLVCPGVARRRSGEDSLVLGDFGKSGVCRSVGHAALSF